jgi:hypothetical protein
MGDHGDFCRAICRGSHSASLDKAGSIHFDWRVLAAAPNIPYKTASASHTPRFVGCCQAANKKSRLMIHHQRQIRPVYLTRSVIIRQRRGAAPSLLDHRRSPLFTSGQDLVLRPAYLGLDDLVHVHD